MCYIDNRKGENNRPQGVDLLQNGYRITTLLLVKVLGWFSMLKTLLDKRKYECQQCQDEHSKSHKVFKIKMFHQHHPHSYVRIEISHPATRLFSLVLFYHAAPVSAHYSIFPVCSLFVRQYLLYILCPDRNKPFRERVPIRSVSCCFRDI